MKRFDVFVDSLALTEVPSFRECERIRQNRYKLSLIVPDFPSIISWH